MINIGLALAGLIFALIFLLSLEVVPHDLFQYGSGGTTCYGWECVDPEPKEYKGNWGGTAYSSCNIDSLKYYDECHL